MNLVADPSLKREKVLVVAGEPSGDTLASRVVAHLNVSVFGMGGPRLQQYAPSTTTGFGSLARLGPLGALARAPQYYRAYKMLMAQVDRYSPPAALLVGFSAFNGQLGRRLLARGIKVLWYSPAQVWAWRPERVYALSRSCHRVALLLPFEVAVWSKAGVPAKYVGHPSLECPRLARPELRAELGWTRTETRVALLPGSRSSEVRRTLPPMLEAATRLFRTRNSKSDLLLASDLPARDRAWARALARRAAVPVHNDCELLPAFDAALATSGTVTLDCTVSGVPSVVAYKTDWVTAALAKRWLSTEHIALPNIIARRRVFPELLQGEVTGPALAEHAEALLDNLQSLRHECTQIRQALALPTSRAPSELVAEMLQSWLS